MPLLLDHKVDVINDCKFFTELETRNKVLMLGVMDLVFDLQNQGDFSS
jgi:hypothetical protein